MEAEHPTSSKLMDAFERITVAYNPLNSFPPPGAVVKSWPTSDLDSGGIRPGEYGKKFDFVFKWTEDHIVGKEMEKMRYMGDPLAEGFLREMNVSPHTDALEHLLKVAGPNRDPSLPPASPSAVALYAQCTSSPSWLDKEAVARGQYLHRRNSFFISKILLHMGLVGGYSSSKINRVLASTRYLIGNVDDTFRRLMETALCIVTFMNDPTSLTPLTGEGWQSTMRVRFLHANVRRRLKDSPKWNAAEWGIPINQEDTIGTLMAFSASIVHSLKTLVGISETEERDYLMLWRYIGYVLGVEEELNPLTSLKRATVFMESLVFHQINPDKSSISLAEHTLRSVANRTPEKLTLAQHASLARLLMGPGIAEAMERPPQSFAFLALHFFGFMGDRIYSNVVGAIPILGPMIIESNWVLMRRQVERRLKGETLSIYAPRKEADVSMSERFEANSGGDQKGGGACAFDSVSNAAVSLRAGNQQQATHEAEKDKEEDETFHLGEQNMFELCAWYAVRGVVMTTMALGVTGALISKRRRLGRIF